MEVGKSYYHTTRGESGIYTEICFLLDVSNPDNTSTFLEFNDEVLEVTKELLLIPS